MGDPQPADKTGIDARTLDGEITAQSDGGGLTEKVSVRLTEDTYGHIKKRVEAGEFASPSDAIRWVIRLHFKPHKYKVEKDNDRTR